MTVDGEEAVVQRTGRVGVRDQVGIGRGEFVANRGKTAGKVLETAAHDDRGDDHHDQSLHGVGVGVRVGAADENVAEHEADDDHQALYVGEPEVLLHDDRQRADDEHHEEEVEEADECEEDGQALRVVALPDPLRQGHRAALGAQLAKADAHRHQPQDHAEGGGEAEVEQRRQAVGVDQPRVDYEGSGRGD